MRVIPVRRLLLHWTPESRPWMPQGTSGWGFEVVAPEAGRCYRCRCSTTDAERPECHHLLVNKKHTRCGERRVWAMQLRTLQGDGEGEDAEEERAGTGGGAA